MALEQPVMPAEAGSQSFFISGSSPASPVPYKRFSRESQKSNNSSHTKQSSLSGQSDTLAPPPSPYPQFTDPSPVDSNGTASTETTEIEDDGDIADDESKELESDLDFESPNRSSGSPLSPGAVLGRIDTSLAARARSDSEQPQSVIHAPQTFRHFNSKPTSPRPNTASKPTSPNDNRVGSTSPAPSTRTITSPRTPQDERAAAKGAPSPSLDTNVPPVPASERVMATPQAQTREEHESEWNAQRRRSSSLERIPEAADADHDGSDEGPENFPPTMERSDSFSSSVPEERQESVKALQDCLLQAWGLCISLSGLSSNHRNRIFNYGRKSEVQNQAWKSCWKLCQKIYDCWNEDHDLHVTPTLDLMREFCQALFDARSKSAHHENTDAVLRVSFELNNHLYNAHDRDVPSGFQERTLEFYLTLCHRLMKLDLSLPTETGRLLHSCWTLVEMLFTLRQNNREGNADDEDALTNAIRACWELTDQFKDGWTQTIPSRSTPRASQGAFSPTQVTPFKSSSSQYNSNDRSVSRASTRSSASIGHNSHASSARSYTRQDPIQAPPETPTTVFDDTTDHIDSFEDNAPNILVLGPENPRAPSNSSLHRSSNPHHWSSAASAFSESSIRTSSTATVGSSSRRNIPRLRAYLVHLAKKKGFVMPLASPNASPRSRAQHIATCNTTLIAWVRGLNHDKFSDEPEQRSMFEDYRKMMLTTYPLMSERYGYPKDLIVEREDTVSYAELGRAMLWMVKNQQYAWLRDMFRVTMKCTVEGALKDNQSSITA